jgi:hypothetical protein
MIPELFPRDHYYCVLDEQPDVLVPPDALVPYAGRGGSEALVVNPRCWMGWHGSLPPALAAAAVSSSQLFDFPWIIWVDDPDRATLWPFWLGPRYAELLQHLHPGQVYDGGLPSDVVHALRVADILTTPEAASLRRQAWSEISAAAAAQFERGLVPLAGLLPPFHLGALRRYYRYHTRVGSFALGDEQAPGRYVSFDEPTTRFVHEQLARTVSDVARRVVIPSYNYLALYQGGASLDPHTDREACEYTLSLCIDATPDPRAFGAWPLNVAVDGGPVSITQGIGEALLFRGRYLTHWRDPLPAGYTSSSVLFHFVDAS